MLINNNQASSGRSALVLEGGGLRGVFTSGVLEAFLDNNVSFDAVYGVSAGASNAVTYISKQKGRNKRVFIDYVKDPRYMGIKSFLTSGDYFNKKFIFEDIPNKYDPFDFESFNNRHENLAIPITCAKTAKTHWITQFKSNDELSNALKAATSLPILSKPVLFNGKLYFDGGISCPIVIDEVIKGGYERIVYILTQPFGYQKNKSRHMLAQKILLAKYPNVVKALENRHTEYNNKLKRIKELEASGSVKVIRPLEGYQVARTETNQQLMIKSYNHGYEQGLSFINANYKNASSES